MEPALSRRPPAAGEAHLPAQCHTTSANRLRATSSSPTQVVHSGSAEARRWRGHATPRHPTAVKRPAATHAHLDNLTDRLPEASRTGPPPSVAEDLLPRRRQKVPRPPTPLQYCSRSS